MSENQVVSSCIKWLWFHGVYCWRNNTGKYKTTYARKDGTIGKYQVAYGLTGSSDILGLTRSGRFIAVECKFGKNKLQPLQEDFGEKVIAHGGIFIVAYSVDDLEKRKDEIINILPIK